MKRFIFLILAVLILASCSCSEIIDGYLDGCKKDSDCSSNETCNLDFNKCENIVFTPKWTYQMEKFDEVENPYLFVEWDTIRVIDLKRREFVKMLQFKYTIETRVSRNPKNGKFYFFNKRWDPKTDEPFGLMELDPKTGLVSLLTDNFSDILFGNISDNGKVYLITNKPCKNEDFDSLLGIKIEVFDTNNYKDKVICIPTAVNHLYKGINGKLYTQGGDGHNNASIYEIDPKDDSIRTVLAPIEAEGGWHIVSVGENYIYFTRHGDLYRVNIKTGEYKKYYFSLSVVTDGRTYYFNYDGFNVGDDLFVLTYNRDIEYSHLVKYDTKKQEATWLYSDVTPSFEAYYRPDANCVIINKGVVFYIDDFQIKQFNSKGHLDKEPIKKF